MNDPQGRIQQDLEVQRRQHAESERIRQEQIGWFTDDELKKKFGPGLRLAAWQLGARQAANEFLYGMEHGANFVRKQLGDKSVPIDQNAPRLTKEEASLRARYPGQAALSRFFTDKSLTKGTGHITKGANGFNPIESFGFGQVTNQIERKARSNSAGYGTPYGYLPYATGEYRDD